MKNKTELDKAITTAAPPRKMADAIAEAPLFRASAHVIDRLAPPWSQTINERELLSIYALLAYVSHNQNVQQELVQMVVEAEFGVDNVAKIRCEDYERAIAFLVDLRLDEMVN